MKETTRLGKTNFSEFLLWFIILARIDDIKTFACKYSVHIKGSAPISLDKASNTNFFTIGRHTKICQEAVLNPPNGTIFSFPMKRPNMMLTAGPWRITSDKKPTLGMLPRSKWRNNLNNVELWLAW